MARQRWKDEKKEVKGGGRERGAAGAAGKETEAALTLMVKGSFLLRTGSQSCVCVSVLMLFMLQ